MLPLLLTITWLVWTLKKFRLKPTLTWLVEPSSLAGRLLVKNPGRLRMAAGTRRPSRDSTSRRARGRAGAGRQSARRRRRSARRDLHFANRSSQDESIGLLLADEVAGRSS